MNPRDVTLDHADRLLMQASEADVAFRMDEDAFCAFYERTARPLWAYASRITGDPHFADDVLQESYYRFLRAGVPWESETHCRRYLFRRDAHHLSHKGSGACMRIFAFANQKKRVDHIIFPDRLQRSRG